MESLTSINSGQRATPTLNETTNVEEKNKTSCDLRNSNFDYLPIQGKEIAIPKTLVDLMGIAAVLALGIDLNKNPDLRGNKDLGFMSEEEVNGFSEKQVHKDLLNFIAEDFFKTEQEVNASNVDSLVNQAIGIIKKQLSNQKLLHEILDGRFWKKLVTKSDQDLQDILNMHHSMHSSGLFDCESINEEMLIEDLIGIQKKWDLRFLRNCTILVSDDIYINLVKQGIQQELESTPDSTILYRSTDLQREDDDIFQKDCMHTKGCSLSYGQSLFTGFIFDGNTGSPLGSKYMTEKNNNCFSIKVSSSDLEYFSVKALPGLSRIFEAGEYLHARSRVIEYRDDSPSPRYDLDCSSGASGLKATCKSGFWGGDNGSVLIQNPNKNEYLNTLRKVYSTATTLVGPWVGPRPFTLLPVTEEIVDCPVAQVMGSEGKYNEEKGTHNESSEGAITSLDSVRDREWLPQYLSEEIIKRQVDTVLKIMMYGESHPNEMADVATIIKRYLVELFNGGGPTDMLENGELNPESGRASANNYCYWSNPELGLRDFYIKAYNFLKDKGYPIKDFAICIYLEADGAYFPCPEDNPYYCPPLRSHTHGSQG